MKNIAIVVHGGAGPHSEYIKKNEEAIKKGLEEAINKGYKILKEKGSAVDAVEAAVMELEDNPLFNAGRGSALNSKGEVEMCSSIMDGDTLNSGAVAILRNVKNPVSLATAIMRNTGYIYLGNEGALDYAKKINMPLEPESYFITEHQYDAYAKKRKKEYVSTREIALEQIDQRMHGTVGAVAVDSEGNIAAATSTGGAPNSKEGRIADSSMIGVGTYADNKTCAVSGTGDGEYLIRQVICHSISEVIRYKELPLQKACHEIIHVQNKEVKGDIGVIAVDKEGNIAMEFNSDRMPCAWKKGSGKTNVEIYKKDKKVH